jgi:hypothetical protein
MKERVRPTIAGADGLILKAKLEMKTEKSGAVLTRTVAFNTVVSLTAEMKKIRCTPRKRPSKKRSLMFLFIRSALNNLRKASTTIRRAALAIIIRQNAIEKVSIIPRNLTKIDAVPKSMPPTVPSAKESLLVPVFI